MVVVEYHVLLIMTMQKTEAVVGITLASFPFQENAHILSIFSKEHGKIKCVTKSYSKSKARGFSPLLGVEMVVIPSDKELWKCKECIVTTSYQALRLSLTHLRFAAEVTDLINRLLPLQHPVPELYALYSQFLADIAHMEPAHSAACIFLEKLLITEGMLDKERGLSDLGYYTELVHIAKGGT